MTNHKESFSEYRKKIKGAGTKNNHPFDIRNSWGVYDYYKAYRHEKTKENKPRLNQHDYFKLIRLVNSMLTDYLIKEKRVELPYSMGTVEIMGYNYVLKMVDGKLKTTRRIDWDSTLRLWYEDAEAEKNKTLVRFDDAVGAFVKYSKKKAQYINKTFYGFRLHREKKELLKKAIKSDGTDLPYFVDTDLRAINNLYNG